jgi:hypothetical protein
MVRRMGIFLFSAVGVTVLAGGVALYHNAVRAAKVAPVAPLFPSGAIWNQDISHAPLDPQSSAIINWLAAAGGWGGIGKMHVDTELRVLQADANTPRVPFQAGPETFFPSSDNIESVPLPVGGGIEGQHGYQCNTHVNDCHLIVVDRSQGKLYEAWGSEVKNSVVIAKFMGVWDLNRVYPPSGRGDQCTSADAAGLPIAPLLFSADELASGQINHAIRFMLPPGRMRARVFVHPATHTGGASGPDLAPPMGVRFRLKASFDMSQLSPAAQVVARAMQKYGMILADQGNMTITAQNDMDTKTKYDDVGFDSHSLYPIKVTDFEIVKMGEPIRLTNDCVRNRF